MKTKPGVKRRVEEGVLVSSIRVAPSGDSPTGSSADRICEPFLNMAAYGLGARGDSLRVVSDWDGLGGVNAEGKGLCTVVNDR